MIVHEGISDHCVPQPNRQAPPGFNPNENYDLIIAGLSYGKGKNEMRFIPKLSQV
jgi:hypothetical protein